MSELALDWVPAGEHTSADLEYVLQADEQQPLIDRIPLEAVDNALHSGSMQLFRLRPGPGVLLTEIQEAYGLRRLSLLRGAGKAGHQLKSIMRLLGATAQEWGCAYVETVVYSSRLKRALELSGASVEGFIMKFALETSDGQ